MYKHSSKTMVCLWLPWFNHCVFGFIYSKTMVNFNQGRCADLIFCVFRVLDQHKLTKEQWEERIQIWHEEHRGIPK